MGKKVDAIISKIMRNENVKKAEAIRRAKGRGLVAQSGKHLKLGSKAK
jgi:hypothetical protein